MSEYDEIILSAVAELATFALSFGIEPDARKLAQVVSTVMFFEVDDETFCARVNEIEKVASAFISCIAAIESVTA